MDHVMTHSGLRSITAYLEMDPRPIELWCAGKTPAGTPCMQLARARNLDSTLRPTPHFYASPHLPGCDEGRTILEVEGDSGHPAPVDRANRVRIRLGAGEIPTTPRSLRRPDEAKPGTATRRLRTGTDGEAAHTRDTVERTPPSILRTLMGGGFPPETIIVEPVGGHEVLASDYFVHLTSAGTAPLRAPRAFWGTVQEVRRREDSGSLGLSSRPAGAPRGHSRPVYLNPHLEERVRASLASQDLVGCVVLVFGSLAETGTYVRYARPEHILVMDPPAPLSSLRPAGAPSVDDVRRVSSDQPALRSLQEQAAQLRARVERIRRNLR